MHLGQLSTNDSWSPRVSEHDGEERMDLSSSVLELYFREGGHVLAKIAGYTLKKYEKFGTNSYFSSAVTFIEINGSTIATYSEKTTA